MISAIYIIAAAAFKGEGLQLLLKETGKSQTIVGEKNILANTRSSFRKSWRLHDVEASRETELPSAPKISRIILPYRRLYSQTLATT